MIVNLGGRFDLLQDGKQRIEGHLPGSVYLDYMTEGMADPFYGLNENTAHELGHHDYTYARCFTADSHCLGKEYIEFVGDGIDTIGKIYINDVCIGSTANIHRTYRFDVKSVLHEGENTLRIELTDPYRYMEEEALKRPKFPQNTGDKCSRYIRKDACHFGWDWGPKLCPSGVMRDIYLEAYDARIEDVQIIQHHEDGKVSLTVVPNVAGKVDIAKVRVALVHPNGDEQIFEGAESFEIDIKNPQLWWPNGLGEQPLYLVKTQLVSNGEIIDEKIKQIGLRTLALDRSCDEDGEQFRFVVNGVPIFAKGADWIPSDQFVTRFTREDMEFYIAECSKAHFNMLRVWGGGSYESEDFYDMCDKYGILVWQDFMFACNLYPFDEEEFLENCRNEVRDNVRRIRHRASLALWCGNNEIEVIKLLIKQSIMDVNQNFFHNVLPSWVQEDDPVTPYWPGSPSSGYIDGKLHNFKKGKISGDSHLWNIWHGMLPIEKFKTFPTRFCSEFGMESMPAFKTIKRFNPNPKPELFDEVMLLHQKSGGGNAKIMYYLLAKYNNPECFEDFVYLSQLVQADTVRYATECWKRNIGKQNGALYWQLNDTYPVASWASIDYYKQLKAAQYQARNFNKMLMISNDYFRNRFDLYVINEYNEEKKTKLRVELKDFSGKVLDMQNFEVAVSPVSSQRVTSYRFRKALKGKSAKKCYVKVALMENGCAVDEKTYLPVEDKKARLPKKDISVNVRQEGSDAVITLRSDSFKRYVFVDSDLVWSPMSDNFFDLEPGCEKEIRVSLDDVDIDSFCKSLTTKDLSSIQVDKSAIRNKLLRTKMFFKDKNWLTYVVYKIFLP